MDLKEDLPEDDVFGRSEVVTEDIFFENLDLSVYKVEIPLQSSQSSYRIKY